MNYAWIITKDHLYDPTKPKPLSEVNTAGPAGAPDELLMALRAGKGLTFRIKDSDGIVYYTGLWICDEDMPDQVEVRQYENRRYLVTTNLPEEAFGPLWDFGTPNDGATDIEYRSSDGHWGIL